MRESCLAAGNTDCHTNAAALVRNDVMGDASHNSPGRKRRTQVSTRGRPQGSPLRQRRKIVQICGRGKPLPYGETVGSCESAGG